MKKRSPEQSPERLSVLARIEEYESQGRFDQDVEEDPPGEVLHPEDVKYLDKSFFAECKRNFSFLFARLWFHRMCRKGKLYLNPPEGIAHFKEIEGGVLLTCNHFHPYDSFIMQKVFDMSHRRGRMYRIIREGNYTAFPGFFGMLMRHCDTLPLSSDPATMKHFARAIKEALAEGNALLIYPEGSLWWHYKKPKPLKLGAFEIAARRGVPVLPCFITFEDTDEVGEDGFPIRRYTPHIGEPIFPDASLPLKRAAEKMKTENEDFCRTVYERVYGIPLSYTASSASRS